MYYSPAHLFQNVTRHVKMAVMQPAPKIVWIVLRDGRRLKDRGARVR